MTRAGCGLSEDADLTEAVLRSVDEAMSQGKLDRADIAFVFATMPHAARLSEVTAAIRDFCEVRSVIGSSGTGVLTTQKEVEGTPGLAVLLVQSDRIRFRTFGSTVVRGREDQIMEHLAMAPATTKEGAIGPARLLYLLPHLSGFDPDLYFRAVRRRLGMLPCVGGGSSNLGAPAVVVQDDALFTSGICGALLDGWFSLRLATAQSVRAVTQPLVVTAVDRNRVLTLDGIPSLDLLSQVSARLFGLDPLRGARTLLVAIAAEGMTFDDRDFTVRHLSGIDPRSRCITLPEPVKTGQQVAFCVFDPRHDRSILESRLSATRLEGARFGLYVNCAARGKSFYGESGINVRAIRAVHPDLPLAGFFSSGEIATSGQQDVLRLYTGVLAVIGDS